MENIKVEEISNANSYFNTDNDSPGYNNSMQNNYNFRTFTCEYCLQNYEDEEKWKKCCSGHETRDEFINYNDDDQNHGGQRDSKWTEEAVFKLLDLVDSNYSKIQDRSFVHYSKIKDRSTVRTLSWNLIAENLKPLVPYVTSKSAMKKYQNLKFRYQASYGSTELLQKKSNFYFSRLSEILSRHTKCQVSHEENGVEYRNGDTHTNKRLKIVKLPIVLDIETRSTSNLLIKPIPPRNFKAFRKSALQGNLKCTAESSDDDILFNNNNNKRNKDYTVCNLMNNIEHNLITLKDNITVYNQTDKEKYNLLKQKIDLDRAKLQKLKQENKMLEQLLLEKS